MLAILLANSASATRPLGALIVLVLGLVTAAVFYVVVVRVDSSAKSTSRSEISSDSNHDKYQRTIADLESKVERSQKVEDALTQSRSALANLQQKFDLVQAQLDEKSEDEPQISGRIDEVYFYPYPGGPPSRWYILLKAHIENNGGETRIQNFKLQFNWFDQQFDRTLGVPPDKFKLRRWEFDREIDVNLARDLRDCVGGNFKYQFPEDGWLCFSVFGGPGVLDRFDPASEPVRRGVRLELGVIDGTGKQHTILQEFPFSSPGKIELKDSSTPP